MIKFFRKIRYNLMETGKTGKYLKYAIGEIILVVIGIMIAVQLNNKNQDLVQQKEIEAILVKIQKEIIADLHYSNKRLLKFIERDSLKNRILKRQITYNELKTGKINLLDYSSKYFLFSMKTAGYEQLMEHLDDLPGTYDNLLGLLDRHYRSGTIQRTRAKLDVYEVVQDYKKYLTENESWYGQDLYHNTISDAQINFYLKNPYFLNHITRLNEAINISIRELVSWRIVAIRIYHKINEILGENSKTIPDIARTTSLNSASESAKYVGTYVLTKGPKNTGLGSRLVVTSNRNNLFIQFNDEHEPIQLRIMHETKPWFVFNSYSASVFRFGHRGPNTISVIRGNHDQTEWIKVDEE
ncbi:hypothetical protein [Winogradskyella sp. A2]|uniref:hypothetical protein n=1 Tax=Winogradskyella sp. A2 TaxID=3366944 RepID=UPI00398C39A5